LYVTRVHPTNGDAFYVMYRESGSVVGITEGRTPVTNNVYMSRSPLTFNWEETSGVYLKDYIGNPKMTKKLARRVSDATGRTVTHYCLCGTFYHEPFYHERTLQCPDCGRTTLAPIGKKWEPIDFNGISYYENVREKIDVAMSLVDQKILHAFATGCDQFNLHVGYQYTHFRVPRNHFFKARANNNLMNPADLENCSTSDGMFGMLVHHLSPTFIEFAQTYGDKLYGTDHAEAVCLDEEVTSRMRSNYIYSAFRQSDMARTIARKLFGENSTMDMVREAMEPLYFSMMTELASTVSVSVTGSIEFPDVSTESMKATAPIVLRQMGWSEENLNLLERRSDAV
jgi:hypothetical protein